MNQAKPPSAVTWDRHFLLPAIAFLAGYFVVLFFITTLFEQLILNAASTATPILMVFAIVLYAVSVGFVIVLWRLSHRRASELRKQGLRRKILLTFVFIALFTSIPQGYLAFRVAMVSTELIIGGDLYESLDRGLLALYGVYQERIERYARDVRSLAVQNPDRLARQWEELSQKYPELIHLSFHQEERPPVTFGTPEDSTVPWQSLTEDGQWLPFTTVDGEPAVACRWNARDGHWIAVTRIPALLEEGRLALQKNLDFLLQVRTYRGLFLTVFFLVFVVLALPLLALVIVGSFFWSNQLTKPLEHLKMALAEVKRGNYHQRLPVDSDDEIGQLTESFNDMVSDLEETKKKVLMTEKIETWRDVAQQLAHEIRNPLTPIRLNAERLLRKHRQDPVEVQQLLEAGLEKILSNVDRLETLLIEFHEFARTPPPVPQEVDFAALVDETCAELDLRFARVVWEKQLTPVHGFRADFWQLRRVLTILLTNAVEASSPPVRVVIESSVQENSRKWYRIGIKDFGVGIPELNRRKIFQPYFTTKPNGTGLGLAFVERVVHEHGGKIWFESRVGVGTEFTLLLPLEGG